MAIVVKFNAVKISAKTKSSLLDKLAGNSIWSSRSGFRRDGNFLVKRDDRGHPETARLYSLEKHNRKVHTTKRLITRGKNKGQYDVTKTVVREGAWIAHYYDVPVNMLDGKLTVQGNRTFKLKLK